MFMFEFTQEQEKILFLFRVTMLKDNIAFIYLFVYFSILKREKKNFLSQISSFHE